MGNYWSRSLSFKVYNVDAKLTKLSKAEIEIKNDNLILRYDKDSTAEIRWDLKDIRRYGYNKNIFLFECGRRSSTGEGLFAFKCNKAKCLNNLLKNASIISSIKPQPNRDKRPPLKNLLKIKNDTNSTDENFLSEPTSQNYSPALSVLAKTPSTAISHNPKFYFENNSRSPSIETTSSNGYLTPVFKYAEEKNQITVASTLYYVNEIKNYNLLPLIPKQTSVYYNDQVDPKIVDIVNKIRNESSFATILDYVLPELITNEIKQKNKCSSLSNYVYTVPELNKMNAIKMCQNIRNESMLT